jgi:two-component system, OmpR family, response regulator
MSLPDRKSVDAFPASGPSDASPVRKVVVVDDSQDARAILQLLLTKLGHHARTAEDVRTGIAVTRDFQPEIVFCDLMLTGGLSGYAFAKAAREEEALAGLCIVAVSGWEGPDYERQAYAAGFDRLLKKPVDLSDLQEILRSPPVRGRSAVAPPNETGEADSDRAASSDK